jgi:hypothetical protein
MRREDSSSSAGIDFRAQLRGRFVDEIDRLVRQEAIRDVAVRKRRRSDQRGILDAHAVMDFVAVAQTAQDRNRVFDARLIDEYRLEAAFERRIFFDVLPILVERRRTDEMQFATREHGLEKVTRVHRAFGFSRTDDVVQFVDEEQHGTLGRENVFEHGLEALFEFAAKLRARDERAHVERDDALVFERLRNVAAHDALREPLDDRRLTDAGFADEHRVVFRAAREYLNHATDLVVAADHRVEFALLRSLREVLAVALERLVRAFRILCRDALVAAHVAQGPEHLVARDAALAEQLSRRARVLEERE